MNTTSPNQSEILSQVIQLYEFSLAIGNYAELRENCRSFFDRILARRNLSYAGLWMHQPVDQPDSDFQLMYSDPASEYSGPRELPATTGIHALFASKQLLSITRSDLAVREILQDFPLPQGDSFTLVELPGIGFIIFAGYENRAIWQPWQLNQMVPIFKSFAASLMSNIHFAQLQQEISDRKLAEEKANRASKIKGEFLANMSHELRTPLNAVLGMSQLLRETDLEQEQLELVNTILSSGQSLLDLINSILDFSKLDAHKVTLELIPFVLQETLDVVFQTFRNECARKNLIFEVNVDSRIPRVLSGDPLRVKQILMNLVGNAVKFTRKGGIAIHAKPIGVEKKHIIVKFIISDSGIGIEERHIDSLFDSFHQVDSSITRKFGGTGLGLSICKQLTELMGGTIDVKSEFHKGSEFVVSIPFEIPIQFNSPSAENGTQTDNTTPGKGTILVVEDNRVNQVVANKLLEKLGYAIDIVATGYEAIERLQSDHYDLVFMDMQMPGMDGLETTRMIRDQRTSIRNPEVIVLAMTANNSQHDRDLCKQAGMNDFLSKPIDKRQLAEKIRRWLPATMQ